MANDIKNINQAEKVQILKKLFSLQRFGIKPGLERTIRLLEAYGNPHLNFPSIHVAGTNGKGSVCSMVASILTEAGYKVGLYTSPHIIDFNERIRINGKTITDDELISLTNELMPVSDKLGCTFFEITTAMAFKYFSDKKIDISVIETGMGGRFDSTNVLNPIISAITPIGLDHQEYLGNTLEEIAFEKAGIIKVGVPVIIGDDNKKIEHIFLKKAEEMNSEIIFVENQFHSEVKEYSADLSMTIKVESENFSFNTLNVETGGKHQLNNVLTALAIIKKISNQYSIKETAIVEGLSNIRENTGLVGRLELLRKKPPLVIDVAHNPASVQVAVDTLLVSGYKDTKWTIVFGAMADKDILQMLKILEPICNKLIATRPNIERAEKVENIIEFAKNAGINKTESSSSVSNAVQTAFSNQTPILIIGSFYLIGEALLELKNISVQ
ncbi:MAG: folylpolyglutamate synthase/dihydrofolate synthase family protein [FCB group bacterium]|jgi:dihydrofolate synthase/folylpolyglutamate synthase